MELASIRQTDAEKLLYEYKEVAKQGMEATFNLIKRLKVDPNQAQILYPNIQLLCDGLSNQLDLKREEVQ